MNLNEPSQTPISAFCSCKGGADGFCRHIIATLFKIESYVNDHNQRSVTSGPCLWIQKGNKSSQPLPVVELQMDIAKHEIHHLHTEQQYNPVPENIPLPDPEQFIQILENHLPKSCMLDLHRVKVTNRTTSLPCKPLQVLTPMSKLDIFFSCHTCTNPLECDTSCFDELLSFLQYNEDEIKHVEVST